MEKVIKIGMVGAGRATELHMEAYKRVHSVRIVPQCIFDTDKERRKAAKERFGFEYETDSFDELLNNEEIDVIDICSPPYTHIEMARRALENGKHVVCEKPLGGYFGDGLEAENVGKTSKRVMYEKLLKSLEGLKETVNSTDKKFMYAENFIYAPAIAKAAEIISAKKSRILFIKGEESLKGSSSPVAGLWSKTGGGTMIRTGTHPLSAALWLKHKESVARGEKIYVKSVVADMECITPTLSEYEHRHIAASPVDVEDIGTIIITFSDKSRAVIIATDTLLGGSRNYVELYCNDAVLNCRLTMNDSMSTYFLDEDGLSNVDISEMLPSKLGWNNPFIEDETMRGYMAEMQNFMGAVAFGDKVESDFELAYDTIRVIYAAYLSAEEGKRIELD